MVLFVGCSREPAAPALGLLPAVRRLAEIAAKEPKLPDAEAMKALADLVELSFMPGAADARLAARSQKALFEHPHVLAGLEQGLGHADATVRALCAYQLGLAKSRHSVPLLLLRLKYENEAHARIWVAATLAYLANGSGLGILIESLRKDELAEEAGRAALEIAGKCGKDLGESPSWARVEGALRELERTWLESGAELFAMEPDPGADARVQARLASHMLATEGFQLRPVDEARFVMARRGRAAVPLLRIGLSAQEVYLRSHSLEVVAVLGHPARELFAPTAALLSDRVSVTFALRALGALGSPEAVPHLLMGTRSSDPETRAAAAAGLVDIADASVSVRLRELLHDPAELMDVRVQAAAGLARLDGGGEGIVFLEARKQLGDYHAPTIAILLEKVRRMR